MEHNLDHSIHSHHRMMHKVENQLKEKKQSTFMLAMSATLHCLIGCGIGEVVGVIIGTAFGLDMITTMIIAVILGFIGGLLLGIVPLLRASFTFKNALKTVIVAEGLSIVVMETFEVLTQILIPGVMEARLTESIFWYGMFAALVVGFIAALPVNYVMIKKGVRHQH
jgi:F0F1-type ATP synthase assembly protein I